jgi:hypothetical protein
VALPKRFVQVTFTDLEFHSRQVTAAYDSCFGEEYNFDDLGVEPPNSGLEACFYEHMDWVMDNEVDPARIKSDMAGLEASNKVQFDGNVDSCVAWSGSFAGNRYDNSNSHA